MAWGDYLDSQHLDGNQVDEGVVAGSLQYIMEDPDIPVLEIRWTRTVYADNIVHNSTTLAASGILTNEHMTKLQMLTYAETTTTTSTTTTTTAAPPCHNWGTWYSGSTALQSCQGLSGETALSGSTASPQIGSLVFTDVGCNTAAPNGYYSDGGVEYIQVTSGEIVAIGDCDDVTTTTTSTTTTTAAPCHEHSIGWSDESRAAACDDASAGGDFVWSRCAVIDTGCSLFDNHTCTSHASETGYYASGSSSWTYSEANGLQNKEACPAPTTTTAAPTTTTTTAAPTTTTTTTAGPPPACTNHGSWASGANASAACGASPTVTIYSPSATLQIGSEVYSDSDCSIALDAGFYSDALDWMEVQEGEIFDMGSCIE